MRPPTSARLHHLLKLLQPDELAELVGGLDDKTAQALLYDWRGAWARDAQLIPAGDDWFAWLVLAGRGWGKTKTSAEAVRAMVEDGTSRRVAFIGATAADARDVMIEGESGLLACSPPWFYPRFEPSKRRITWPNGAIGTLYSAEEGDRLRGPQHDLAWGDEPASWVGPEGFEGKPTWDNLVLGLRLGLRPRVIISGTPRPVWLVRELLKMPRVITTRGNTYENTHNLAPTFKDQILRMYEGTSIGRQELYAEMLDAIEGALFSRLLIDAFRVATAPQLDRVVISVDPAPTSKEGSDYTGIVAMGRGPAPEGWKPPRPGASKDGSPHGYILQDHSVKGSPDRWAREVVKAFHLHKADRVIAEINMGGEMVESTIKSIDPDIPFKAVRAMRGKAKRAEPLSALYEQGKIHHVGDGKGPLGQGLGFELLESQMGRFTGVNGVRDDRVDALIWGGHELLIRGSFGFA